MEQERINNQNFCSFDLSIAADQLAWLELLGNTAAGVAKLANFQQGDILFDRKTGTKLIVSGPFNTITVSRRVYGDNCKVIPKTVAAGVSIAAFKFVKFAAGSLITPVTGQGEVTCGISLNAAEAGENVYIMTLGDFLVIQGATPAALGARVTTDNAGNTDTTAAADNFVGITLEASITVGLAVYDFVSYRMPSILA